MAKNSNKGRKIGRMKDWCKAYRASKRREHNKITRLTKHLIRHPEDSTAEAALKRYENLV